MEINRQNCELVEIICDKDEIDSVHELIKNWNIIRLLYSGPVTKDYKCTGKYRRLLIIEK